MSPPEPTDADLLRQYAANASEPAFRELVRRHLAMVRATARRVLANIPHLADDVAQNAFSDLARKAADLPAGTVLGGWLHRHSYYLALNVARAEHRRHARERTAMEIRAINETPNPDENWACLAPALDEALDQLDPEDRDAIVLRYLEQRDLHSVGSALGVSADTAQKRVSRALEKLRAILTQRQVAIASAAALAATLDAGVTAVPLASGTAAIVSTTAMETAASSPVATLTISKIMPAAKFVLSGVLVVLAAGVVIAIQTRGHSRALPGSIAGQKARTAIVTSATKPTAVQLPKFSPVTANSPAQNAPLTETATIIPPPTGVIITGLVGNPGNISMPSRGLTLAAAIANAGGPLSNASRYVTITRTTPNGGTQILQRVDLLKALEDSKADISLQNGDIVTLDASVPSQE